MRLRSDYCLKLVSYGFTLKTDDGGGDDEDEDDDEGDYFFSECYKHNLILKNTFIVSSANYKFFFLVNKHYGLMG